METLTKESFEKWAKKHDWLMVNDISSPSGRQHIYLTPSGPLVVAMYDLKGNLFGFGQPAPVPQQPLKAPGLFKPR